MSQFERIDKMEQGNPPAPPPKDGKRSQFKAFLQEAGRWLLSLLTENWGTKLLALFIAIALWAGLIAQDPTLTREKDFQDVDVYVTGAETLKRNGYIVLDDIDDVLSNVDMTVEVPQMQYAAAKASSYNVRIDLSRISKAGEQAVRIQSTNSSTYGTVTRIDPATVTLTVDEYVTRSRVPVTVTAINGVPEGFWAETPTCDPAQVAITGPKSLVQRVATVEVLCDQQTLQAQEGLSRRALPYRLLAENGQEISSRLLEVTNEGVLLDSIIVEQQVWPTREVDVATSGLVRGQVAPGYEIKGIYVTPAHVVIAGRGTLIDELTLFYGENTLDVTGATETIVAPVRVRKPGLVRYVSTDSVTVQVEIAPMVVDRSWTYLPIQVKNLKADLEATLSVTSATLRVTGSQIWLEGLERGDLTVKCDVGGLTEPGTYEVPLTFEVGNDDGQVYTCEVEPHTITVTLTKWE